jgi:hypothetical protein
MTAVADEDPVSDVDSLADERVALDLAACTDDHATLNLDERPDACSGADPALVQVGEGDTTTPSSHATSLIRR